MIAANFGCVGVKKHRVGNYFTLPVERIFNTHPGVKRSALVGCSINNKITPVICIEVVHDTQQSQEQLFSQLKQLANNHDHTKGIEIFLIHPAFPMDIRHNAKIFREKLAVWAEKVLS